MFLRAVVVLVVITGLLAAQVIEFESGGLKYQTLSKNGLTVMFAHLPIQVREYAVLQVAASNGAATPCTVRPENFVFSRSDGFAVRASSAESVVGELLEKAGRNDVIKLTSTYEMGLYGMVRFRSTNGYEQRRRSALAEVVSTKLKAAAAASAIAFVETRLKPGESTDGAVFFPTLGRPLGGGKLRFTAAGQVFEFDVVPTPSNASE
jgi:hypothetical protein